MGVVASNRPTIDHGGVVVFAFYGPEGVVQRGRTLARVDALVAYDALRQKYPEHEGIALRVTVLRHSEVASMDRRAVAAKGVNDGPIRTRGGFVRRVDSLGPVAPVGVSGAEAEVLGEVTEEVAAKQRTLMEAFLGAGEQAKPAAPLAEWAP